MMPSVHGTSPDLDEACQCPPPTVVRSFVLVQVLTCFVSCCRKDEEGGADEEAGPSTEGEACVSRPSLKHLLIAVFI